MRRRRKATRASTLAKSVRALLAEKRALLVKEKGFVKLLNGLLAQIGYKVVPGTRATSAVGRRRRRRRRGRPPGRRRAVRATTRRRRRGRARKSSAS